MITKALPNLSDMDNIHIVLESSDKSSKPIRKSRITKRMEITGHYVDTHREKNAGQKGTILADRTILQDTLDRRKARMIHFDETTKDERRKDFETNEKIVHNLAEYIGNSKNVDWDGVDTAIPENLEIRLRAKRKDFGVGADNEIIYSDDTIKGRISLHDKKARREVGYSKFEIHKGINDLEIIKMWIADGYREKGLSDLIRRQVILLADELKLTVATEAQGDNEWSDKELGKHYASYGKKGHNFRNRPPHK